MALSGPPASEPLPSHLAAHPGVHGDARYVQPLSWERPGVKKTFGLDRTHLGLDAPRPDSARVIELAGEECAVGSLLAFEVDRELAFDIDEPVDVTITYAPSHTGPFRVAWNSNGGLGHRVSSVHRPVDGAELRTATFTLERARFAGLGALGTGLAVGGPDGVAVCDLRIVRSHAAPMPPATGRLALHIEDAGSGRPAAARLGLYDSSGRAPLPSAAATPVQRFGDEVRLLTVHPRIPWPSTNREAFYAEGTYEAEVPAGRYEIVATRGPEYRVFQEEVQVVEGETRTVSIRLERYADLPGRGWFSGDSHLHLARGHGRDEHLATLLSAEDLYVGNLLEMGNIRATYFQQPWTEGRRLEQEGRALVLGQEDPRTPQRGHTIHQNLERPVRLGPDRYFLYHEAFEEARRQGGVSGYAHMGELYHGERGLALDVPFRLVDFIEVLQGGRMFTDVWYRYLNLGFRISPVAGSDFPYFGSALPGSERQYVRVGEDPVSGSWIDAWFDAIRSGHVFVTNGPLLELTVNGKPMGSELRVTRGEILRIRAEGRLNPDVERLDRLELVLNGEVATTKRARGSDRVELSVEIPAVESGWIALRAYGERGPPATFVDRVVRAVSRRTGSGGDGTGREGVTAAHTAPVYIHVDGTPSWHPESVPELVRRQRRLLHDLASDQVDPSRDLEGWETRKELAEQWEAQLPLLRQRAEEAERRYDEILDAWESSKGGATVSGGWTSPLLGALTALASAAFLGWAGSAAWLAVRRRRGSGGAEAA